MLFFDDVQYNKSIKEIERDKKMIETRRNR